MTLQFQVEDDLWWAANAMLSDWAGFRSRQGDYGAQDRPEESTGEVKIIFAPEGRDLKPLTVEENELVAWFTSNSSEVSTSVVSAVLQHYPKLQADYDYAPDEQAEFMPSVAGKDDLKRIIGLHTIYIHPISKNCNPYLGFEFGCTWDPEHGLGVLMHGNRLVQIGGADTAFMLWIAEKDAEQR